MSENSAATTTSCVSLIDVLRQRAAFSPERQAYIFLHKEKQEPQTLTYRELDQRARAVAARLQQHVAPGERALLLYPSSLEYIIAFFGCLYAGVIAVPVYPPRAIRPNHTMSRLKAIAHDACASVALTTTSLLAKNALVFEEWLGTNGPLSQWIATDKVDERQAPDWHELSLTGETLAFLQYTSGSTAVPKGVMLTHGNLVSNASMHREALDTTEQSTYCSWLPFYHDMGMIAHILESMYLGSTCILMSPTSFLQRPALWLETISRYRVVVSGGPNFAYDLCVERISAEQRAQLDLSSWRVAFMGAEPIRVGTMRRFAEAFAPYGFRWETLYPCYGLAEGTVACTGNKAGTAPVLRSVASKALREGKVVVESARLEEMQTVVGCGTATYGDGKIILVDPQTCCRSASDQVGEIWASGSHVAKGYWGRPEETASTFGAFLQDTGEGPFLRTGDLGFLLNGNIFIAGRLKDLIIIDGTNYYPQDIEQAVERCHPALRSGCCAAFSVDTQGQERLVVVVEVDVRYVPADAGISQGTKLPGVSREPLSPQDILKTIQRAIHEQYEIPTAAVILIKAGTIPKTTSGKIQRRACREEFLNDRLNLWGK